MSGIYKVDSSAKIKHTAQKMKLSTTDFFSKCHQIRSPNPQFPADLVTFTEKILNGELNFLCTDTFLNNFAKNQRTAILPWTGTHFSNFYVKLHFRVAFNNWYF